MFEDAFEHAVDIEDVFDQRCDDRGEDFDFLMRQNLFEIIQGFAHFGLASMQAFVRRLRQLVERRNESVVFDLFRSIIPIENHY